MRIGVMVVSMIVIVPVIMAVIMPVMVVVSLVEATGTGAEMVTQVTILDIASRG